MNKFNPLQYIDVNTLPVALQRGLDMLLRPADTWAQVRAEAGSATVPGLLLGYALWWVLWAVLGGLVVSLVGLGLGWGVGLGTDGASAGLASALVSAIFAAVPQLISWYAVIFIMGLGLHLFAKQQENTAQPPVRLLQLAVHALTPAWLLAPLMALPELGAWAVYVGAGYSLYLAYLGLVALTDRPPDAGVKDVVALGALAAIAALIFDGLVWLALIGGVAWLYGKVQYMLAQATVSKYGSEDEQADANAHANAATVDAPSAPEYATIADHAPGQLSAAPAFESFNEPSFPSSATPAVQAANAAKIAALDKKITKATAQGDMVEVSRLMGERGLLLQTPNSDF